MNEHPSRQPDRLPREQILAARQANLAEYLIARGEPLTPSGQGRYKHADHDSLVFTANAYFWNARKEHGNAIDFLQRFYELSFRAAVEELTSGAEKNGVVLPPTPDRPFDFAQIELAPSMERVIIYLTRERKLSLFLVRQLVDERRLFQEAQTNNAIFPIYEQHKIVGAEVVGTMPDKRFKGIKTGSKYGCGYNVTFGEDKPDFALFFESAIDLLSFVQLSHEKRKNLAGCRLTSMMGLKENIVEHTMQDLPGAEPYLCVDNDEAGQNFAAQMGLKTRLPDPAYKNWNDLLRALRQMLHFPILPLVVSCVKQN